MADTLNFSIETTTLRLKSLKLRRAEAADRELDARLRGPSHESLEPAAARGPAGRVRHDERGMAVWDMAVASGEFAQLSATNVMRRLNVDDLAIEQTQRSVKPLEEPDARDAGGGSDPYNQRKAGIPAQQYSRSGGNPYESGGNGDPYNQRAAARPAPAVKAPRSSVLDQLTGRKK